MIYLIVSLVVAFILITIAVILYYVFRKQGFKTWKTIVLLALTLFAVAFAVSGIKLYWQ